MSGKTDLAMLGKGVKTFKDGVEAIDDLHVKPIPFVIPEDFFIMKVLCCTPFVGVIPSLIQQCSLVNKIYTTKESDRVIKLIIVKNEYKIASVVNGLLTTAFTITSFAVGMISGTGALIMAGAGLAIALLNIYEIVRNSKTVKEIREQGHLGNQSIL